MAKSNDKQHRTRGVMPSSNTELPNPLKVLTVLLVV